MSASLLGVSGPAVADAALIDALAAAIDSADGAGHDLAIPAPATVPASAIVGAVLAVESHAVARHRRLGLPEEITARSLADVGRKIAAYGASVDLPWLITVMRGSVLTFGRIQLERETVDGTRSLHIPEGGPLHPDEVDRALAEGRQFLGDDPVVCTSWLLDPLLQGLRPPSNIAAFARRFDVEDGARTEEADHAVARFVFRRELAAVLSLPAEAPRSGVQRLVLAHLRSGAHWSEPRGRLW